VIAAGSAADEGVDEPPPDEPEGELDSPPPEGREAACSPPPPEGLGLGRPCENVGTAPKASSPAARATVER
jgi:hypothetical protein